MRGMPYARSRGLLSPSGSRAAGNNGPWWPIPQPGQKTAKVLNLTCWSEHLRSQIQSQTDGRPSGLPSNVTVLSARYSRQFEKTDALRLTVPSNSVSRNSELRARSTFRWPISTTSCDQLLIAALAWRGCRSPPYRFATGPRFLDRSRMLPALQRSPTDCHFSPPAPRGAPHARSAGQAGHLS